MKAFILAAGLGTRLRPFTLTNPKALVPVGGLPMLERVIEKLRKEGVDSLVINVHHFGEKIIDFLNTRDFGISFEISDETEELLDTGGAILKAADKLFADTDNVVVHNVDILSNASVKGLYNLHCESDADVTLLVSDRDSSRKLIFDADMNLRGWHNLGTGEYRPAGFSPTEQMKEFAFSGIYAVNRRVVEAMKEEKLTGKFPIMDFLLDNIGRLRIKGHAVTGLKLIDIGKPATLQQADKLFQ